MEDFKHAVQWMREGKSVRRITFAKNRFLFLGVGSVVELDGIGVYPFKLHDFLALDWEIFVSGEQSDGGLK